MHMHTHTHSITFTHSLSYAHTYATLTHTPCSRFWRWTAQPGWSRPVGSLSLASMVLRKLGALFSTSYRPVLSVLAQRWVLVYTVYGRCFFLTSLAYHCDGTSSAICTFILTCIYTYLASSPGHSHIFNIEKLGVVCGQGSTDTCTYICTLVTQPYQCFYCLRCP